MKQFIRKILVFGFSSLFVMVIITFIAFYVINHPKLEDNIDTLIIGDSHPRYALIPKNIPNTVGLTYNAEHYIYTYNKLKIYLENNSQIRRVILGFSTQNFVVSSERRMDTSDIHEMYSRYYFILDDSSKNYCKKIDFKTRLSSLQKLQKALIRPFDTQRYPYNTIPDPTKKCGGANLKKNHVEEMTISPISMKYFHKMVGLCKKYDIELILINTPLHPDLLELSHKDISTYIGKIFREVKYNKAKYLDLVAFELEVCDFQDAVHLNLSGGQKFTKYFNEQLKKWDKTK